jgi:WG containing repeat
LNGNLDRALTNFNEKVLMSITMTPSILQIDCGIVSGRRYMLIDANNKLVHEPTLRRIHRFAAGGQNGLLAPAQAENGKWGYLRHDGSWHVQPHFDDAKRHGEEGLARVKLNDQWGYLSTRGEVAIAPRFEDARAFSHGLAAAYDGKKWGYIDTQGNWVIKAAYSRAEPFAGVGLARVGTNGKFGFIDRSGNERIKPQFSWAENFSGEGVAPVKDKKDLYGLIDVNGDWILKPCYDNIREFNVEGLAYFDEPDAWNNGHGYINAKGEVVIKGGRWLSKNMSAGLVKTNIYSIGFFDQAGKLAIEEKYDWADHFSDCGVAIARLDRVWGILKRDGQFLPSSHREPLTDDDGRTVGFSDAATLAPFLAADRSVVFVNADGEDCLRLNVEDRKIQRLKNMRRELLWEAIAETDVYFTSRAFLARGPQEHFEKIDYWEGDIVEYAKALLAEPSREFCPYSLVFNGERDVYELDEAREDDEDFDEKVMNGAMLVLAQTYVAENIWGEYQFMDTQEGSAFDEYMQQLSARLISAFGEPLRYDEIKNVMGNNIPDTLTWKIDNRILSIERYTESGDGDFEHQIWLTVVDA